MQLAILNQKTMGRKPRALQSQVQTASGDAELFEVHITKVSNGYIMQRATGEMMVFEDAKFAAAIEWIVSRRLKKLEPGEEMEIYLKQSFVKVNEKQCKDGKQLSA